MQELIPGIGWRSIILLCGVDADSRIETLVFAGSFAVGEAAEGK